MVCSYSEVNGLSRGWSDQLIVRIHAGADSPDSPLESPTDSARCIMKLQHYRNAPLHSKEEQPSEWVDKFEYPLKFKDS